MSPAPKPKVQLTNGIPVTLALQYPSGKRVNSRIQGAPDQMYYSLVDGRGIYLPLEVGDMIDRLKLQTGEPFTLCKNGPRDWQVSRVEKQRDYSPPWQEPTTPPAPVNGSSEAAGDILARCYASAIEIALEAVETARTKGLMVTPSFEDLRCISSVLMIAETGRR